MSATFIRNLGFIDNRLNGTILKEKGLITLKNKGKTMIYEIIIVDRTNTGKAMKYYIKNDSW